MLVFTIPDQMKLQVYLQERSKVHNMLATPSQPKQYRCTDEKYISGQLQRW